MSTPDMTPTDPAKQNPAKPVIAIMGEFSVGKSTLTNLLIGSDPLPVKVTATQLPPVWISYGDQSPYREDLRGNSIPVDLTKLDEVPLAETTLIRIFLKSEILELCDLIDMPGISDPNMASDVWERVLHNADGVLWCTHATQAWRQSEAAVWKTMSPELHAKSLLLVTRVDKLLSEIDRKKVIKRVERETQGMFAGLFPVSLTQAIAAKNSRELWHACGAAAFVQRLVELTQELSGNAFHLSATETTAPRKAASAHASDNLRNLILAPAEETPDTPSVTPTRVRVLAKTGRSTRRPRPESDKTQPLVLDHQLMVDHHPDASRQ